MALIFQTSLKKANWQKEKAILIEAGLITEWLDNTWVRFRIGKEIVEVPNGYFG